MHRRTLLQTLGLGSLGLGLSGFSFNENSSIEDQEKIYRLLYNENPDGPSKLVKKMIQRNLDRSNRYATFHLYDFMALKQRIAKAEGLQVENVMLGHGSFEPLTQLAVHFGAEGGEIIVPSPTFDVVGAIARQIGGKVKAIEVNQNLDFDLAQMEGSISPNTKLLTLCNPNNPTGKFIEKEKLLDFCSAINNRCPLMIDEAYIQYLPNWRMRTLAPLIAQEQNVFITRTFSKIYGMAGLRIGYLLGPADAIQQLEKKFTMGFPGNMPNGLSVAAAIGALEDEDFISTSRQRNAVRKALIYDAFKAHAIEFLRSDTNFIYFQVGDFPSFKQHMRRKGILLAGGWPSKAQWARVTMGSEKELEHFVNQLDGKPWLK